MFRFEKLEVWQKAIELANRVYSVTRSFPQDERFGLTSQMRQSAVSVSSNIAEGCGRASDAGFARFLEIAYGSLMEIASQAQVAKLQELLAKQHFDELYQEAERISRMLSGLRAALLKKPNSQTLTLWPLTLDP